MITKVNFRKFLNDSYVEHNYGHLYNVVSNVNYDVGVIVDTDPVKGWSIVENDYLDIDNDAKREMLYRKIDEFKANE